MNMLKRRVVRACTSLTLVVGVAAAGFFVGSAIAVDGDDSDSGVVVESGEDSVDPRHEYPVNESGQTYGSDEFASGPDDAPDLISAVATNGKAGYIDNAEVERVSGGDVSSPEEALRWQTQLQNADAILEVPVYEQDGKTVIGTFVVDTGIQTTRYAAE